MNDQLFQQLQTFRGELNQCFLEREDIIDGVLASLVTQQNCFLFGAPGTGKSELVRAVSQGFTDSKFFSYLLSPTTDPSELYGPVAVSKLLEDEYTRDVKGYLPDSNVAFLDELFRGSSAVLNSLLQLLNERTFNNGKDLISTDIQSIVAATNSFPTEESLQAFCDRFLFRPTVEGLKGSANKNKLYTWALEDTRPKVNNTMTMKDLKSLQQSAREVSVNQNFIETFSQCMNMLESRGISVSDRRKVQILKFLRGWAVVKGGDTLHPDYLHATLPHIVYQTSEDIPIIKEVLDQCVPTADTYFNELQRAANAIMREFKQMKERQQTNVSDASNYIEKLKRSLNDLKVLSQKANHAIDEETMSFTPAMRLKATKVCSELSTYIDTVSRAISTYLR